MKCPRLLAETTPDFLSSGMGDQKCGGRMVTPARGVLAGMEIYTHLFSSLSEVLIQHVMGWGCKIL